jgi:proteasome lid subunit RPN8/RPN11
MAQTAPVAYECDCEHTPEGKAWDEKVAACFAALGSRYPAIDMEAAGVYLANARGKVPPGTAAAVAWATIHHGHPVVAVGAALPTAAEESRRPHHARDYMSVHQGGRKYGPFKGYDEAKKDADAHGGYVEWTAGEHGGQVQNDLPEHEPETRADLSRVVTRVLVSHADVRGAPWRVTLLDSKGVEVAEATDESLTAAFEKARRLAIRAGKSVPVYLQDGFHGKYDGLPRASQMQGGYFGQWPAEGLDEKAAEANKPAKMKLGISGEEERLTKAERDALPESAFALPDERELPLTDKHGKLDPGHITAAAGRLGMLKNEGRISTRKYNAAHKRIEHAEKKAGMKAGAAFEDCVGVHTHTPVTNPEVVVVTGAAAEENIPIAPEMAAEDRRVEGKPRTLRWHRGEQDGEYVAKGHLGEYKITKRDPDRRHGIFPHLLTLNGKQLGDNGFNTKGDAQEFAAAYDFVVPYAAPGETDVRIEGGKALVKGARIIDGCLPWVRITKDPDRFSSCLATARRIGAIDSGAKVYELLAPYLQSSDQEVFLVVLLDVQHMVRGVAEVARGQRSKVYVDPADILRPVIITGASSFWVAHNHPSSRAEPSPADRRLTKAIEKASKAAAPDVEFEGHVVIGGEGHAGQWGDASNGKVHKV